MGRMHQSAPLGTCGGMVPGKNCRTTRKPAEALGSAVLIGVDECAPERNIYITFGGAHPHPLTPGAHRCAVVQSRLSAPDGSAG